MRGGTELGAGRGRQRRHVALSHRAEGQQSSSERQGESLGWRSPAMEPFPERAQGLGENGGAFSQGVWTAGVDRSLGKLGQEGEIQGRH